MLRVWLRGVVKHALEAVRDGDIGMVAETIKKTAFKITRVGQLVAQEAARALTVRYGSAVNATRSKELWDVPTAT